MLVGSSSHLGLAAAAAARNLGQGGPGVFQAQAMSRGILLNYMCDTLILFKLPYVPRVDHSPLSSSSYPPHPSALSINITSSAGPSPLLAGLHIDLPLPQCPLPSPAPTAQLLQDLQGDIRLKLASHA